MYWAYYYVLKEFQETIITCYKINMLRKINNTEKIIDLQNH
jgi:hypothetical protein